MAGFDAGLVDEWVSLWNTYDLSMVETLFLDDDRVSYFSSEKEGAVQGIQALIEHHRGLGFVPGGKQQPNSCGLKTPTLNPIWVQLWSRRYGASSVQTPAFRGGR
jgi:hypothetical protein